MDDAIPALLEQIEGAIGKDSFEPVAEEATDQISSLQDSFEAVELILRMMERHEGADFGMPGPLVHFVEGYFRRGYERLLTESVRRRPTPHTLWMMNRLINGVSGQEKAQYVRELESIVADEENAGPIRNLAREFLELHVPS